MPSIYYSSASNSTFFTTCCRVAINDHQQTCPSCKKDVYPFYEGMSKQDREEAAGGYYNSNTQMARMRAARR